MELDIREETLSLRNITLVSFIEVTYFSYIFYVIKIKVV